MDLMLARKEGTREEIYDANIGNSVATFEIVLHWQLKRPGLNRSTSRPCFRFNQKIELNLNGITNKNKWNLLNRMQKFRAHHFNIHNNLNDQTVILTHFNRLVFSHELDVTFLTLIGCQHCIAARIFQHICHRHIISASFFLHSQWIEAKWVSLLFGFRIQENTAKAHEAGKWILWKNRPGIEWYRIRRDILANCWKNSIEKNLNFWHVLSVHWLAIFRGWVNAS